MSWTEPAIPSLRTARLILRPATPADWPAFLALMTSDRPDPTDLVYRHFGTGPRG
ncbi:hypothetical protein [Paracoccus sp. S1E-3]|uniref:hypothetical protein n=1 Tax=Paracoccus sp. S1E-3 TaxID=2756130 RepID=UPI0015EFADCE|nr:hypothetical protein [Paracoccus sp. S1E-3]MBA4489898.1 hypothetical protein [Paracoccus sp. S1E-3]